MAQTILIKRSSSTASPTSLLAGELAYSGKASSNKLFIGHPDGTTGVVAIGGQYYTGVIDGAVSANTASKLVVRDSSGNFSAGTITATLTGQASDISNHDTDALSEGTNLYYTDARVSTRADTILNHANHGNITVSKVGTELRFTAASQYGDTDVQSYLSGGTGVTLNGSGEFSIGQAVATNSNVTFGTVGCGNITTTGYIRGPSTLTIDPAAHGNDTGTVVIAGDLTIQGTTTTVNSTTVELGDNILELNKQLADNTAPSANAGIEIYRGTGTGALAKTSLLWNETSDYWQVNDGSTTSKLLTAGNFAASFTGTLDGGTF